MAPDPTTPVRLPKPFRTVAHGTCLLGGKHPPGSQLARECPVLRRARRRREVDPGAQNRGAGIPLQGRPETPSSAPAESGTSKTIFRRGRAFRPGRPRVSLVEQRLKARRRDRAYRARQSPDAGPGLLIGSRP
jgi:hypothetical protein